NITYSTSMFYRRCRSTTIATFFFSSRRRHTRSKRDWSSDVCSSDLDKRLSRRSCHSDASAQIVKWNLFFKSTRRPLDIKLRNGKDRKSTRLNFSHVSISYAVFCLKKKKNEIKNTKEKYYHESNTHPE